MWPPRSAAFPLAVRFPHPFMARVAVLDGAVHARRVHGGGHNNDQSDRPEDEHEDIEAEVGEAGQEDESTDWGDKSGHASNLEPRQASAIRSGSRT